MTVFEYRQKQLEIKIKELENRVQVDDKVLKELNALRAEHFATKTYLDIPGDSPEEKLKVYSELIKAMRDFRNAVEIMFL